MASEPPPIAVFAYKRPQHTARTIRSLLRCNGAENFKLHVFSDGAKTGADIRDVEDTRAILKSVLGDRATYTFRNENFGLARSIIAGVSELVTAFGSVIVIEDDLELHPQFLEFMLNAIEAYRNHEIVMQVSGFLLPAPEWVIGSECNFLPFTTSWGWATWERAWKKFDAEAAGWERLRTNVDIRRQFNLNGTLDYAGMLESQMNGKIDSWAIRWYWSVFKLNGLVAYPPISLVTNHGFDGSGTHGNRLAKRITQPAGQQPNLFFSFPNTPKLSMPLFECVISQLHKQTAFYRKGLIGGAYRMLRFMRNFRRNINIRIP